MSSSRRSPVGDPHAEPGIHGSHLRKRIHSPVAEGIRHRAHPARLAGGGAFEGAAHQPRLGPLLPAPATTTWRPTSRFCGRKMAHVGSKARIETIQLGRLPARRRRLAAHGPSVRSFASSPAPHPANASAPKRSAGDGATPMLRQLRTKFIAPEHGAGCPRAGRFLRHHLLRRLPRRHRRCTQSAHGSHEPISARTAAHP